RRINVVVGADVCREPHRDSSHNGDVEPALLLVLYAGRVGPWRARDGFRGRQNWSWLHGRVVVRLGRSLARTLAVEPLPGWLQTRLPSGGSCAGCRRSGTGTGFQRRRGDNFLLLARDTQGTAGGPNAHPGLSRIGFFPGLPLKRVD